MVTTKMKVRRGEERAPRQKKGQAPNTQTKKKNQLNGRNNKAEKGIMGRKKTVGRGRKIAAATGAPLKERMDGLRKNRRGL